VWDGEIGVGMEHLFSGNALGAVDADGRVSLPDFVRRVVERRTDGRRLVFGAHETDPCVTGYDPGHAHRLQADVERLRLRDEDAGLPAEAHHNRARRLFGLVEDADYDAAGRILLPPMMRRRGRIGEFVLFVGTGAEFEIWNPALARESGDPGLRELAEFRLEQSGVTIGEKEERI
jgi:MraZ protein